MVNLEEPENFEYWNKLLKNTPESYKQWFKFEEEYLKENIKPNSTILEVGSGDGRSLNYLTGRECILYGIDYSAEAGLIARKNLNLEGMSANILYMEATDLIFKDNIFDYVLSLTTPANFGSQKNKIYSEMKRVLKPNGEIILNVFNEEAFNERINLYRKLNVPIKEIKGTTVVFEEEGREFTSEQFSREQLEEICKINNLSPIDICKKGIGYFCRFKK